MAGEQKVAAVDPKDPPAESQFGNPALGAAGEWTPIDFNRYAEPPTAQPAWRRWIWPVAAGLALAGWSGFFLWANLAAMIVVHDPGIWTGWISSWATPTLLIGVAWLIGMRSSRRETRRFSDASRLLAAETEQLEARLLTINRELSLAREFVAAQARDLDSVGRIAVDRLSQHAERLAALVQENGAQIEAIGTVSGTALENMERLRSQLPVLTSAAKDVTNNFGNAGRTANAHLEDLIAGFNRLTQFGHTSEQLVLTLRGNIDQALSGFGRHVTALDASMSAGLEALNGKADLFHASLLAHQGEFENQLRSRSVAMASEIAETRTQLDAQEAESITSLRSRLSSLRDETAALSRALRDGESTALASWREAVARLSEDMAMTGRTAEALSLQAGDAGKHQIARLVEDIATADRNLRDTREQIDADADRRRQAGEAQNRAALERLTAQLAAIDEAIVRRREAGETQDRAALERLTAQLAVIDEDMARRHAAQSAKFTAISVQGLAATSQLAEIEARVTAIAETSDAAEARMAQRLTGLTQHLADGRTALTGTEDTLAGLTDSSVRLLELIQASAAHSREDLVQAIDKGAARLGDLESRALNLRDTVSEASRNGEALSSHVLLTQNRLTETTGALAALHGDLQGKAETHARTLDGLHQALARLDSDSAAAASRAQGELTAAIGQLTEAARAAVAEIEQHGTRSISALAAQLGEESGEAMERAMRLRVAEISGKLEQAAAHAAGIGREATQQLRDQLAKVEELIGNLESRVAHARDRAAESVDHEFGRRVALITEALNSNAIDIAKALDADVSDTAWSAYLRGDRGIFTRKAVRLLDAPEARSVIQLYESDHHFRDHVSHYIHDFEAMLRELLSTRDGHAMGVTLLSSDMGKLYVALAQAIERLRN
jgi:hypothetical protein